MGMTLDLSDPRIGISESGDEIATTVLTHWAEQVDPPAYLMIPAKPALPPLSGVGSLLTCGVLCVRGNLGRRTADGMNGGMLWVKGDVERISNVHDGTIYVDGSIDRLVNIHSPTRIFCTGTIGEHLYGMPPFAPSDSLFCRRAPRNSESLSIDEYESVPHEYHYLLRVHEVHGLPRLDFDANIEGRIRDLSKAIAR